MQLMAIRVLIVVTAKCLEAARAAIKSGKSVVIDNTNPSVRDVLVARMSLTCAPVCWSIAVRVVGTHAKDRKSLLSLHGDTRASRALEHVSRGQCGCCMM
jgi:hypothetical protein